MVPVRPERCGDALEPAAGTEVSEAGTEFLDENECAGDGGEAVESRGDDSSLRDDDDIASALPGVLAEQVGQRFGEGLHVLAQIGDDGAVLSAVDHGMGPGET